MKHGLWSVDTAVRGLTADTGGGAGVALLCFSSGGVAVVLYNAV